MSSQLGPFQHFWDVWDAADAQIEHKPLARCRARTRMDGRTGEILEKYP